MSETRGLLNKTEAKVKLTEANRLYFEGLWNKLTGAFMTVSNICTSLYLDNSSKELGLKPQGNIYLKAKEVKEKFGEARDLFKEAEEEFKKAADEFKSLTESVKGDVLDKIGAGHGSRLILKEGAAKEIAGAIADGTICSRLSEIEEEVDEIIAKGKLAEETIEKQKDDSERKRIKGEIVTAKQEMQTKRPSEVEFDFKGNEEAVRRGVEKVKPLALIAEELGMTEEEKILKKILEKLLGLQIELMEFVKQLAELRARERTLQEDWATKKEEINKLKDKYGRWTMIKEIEVRRQEVMQGIKSEPATGVVLGVFKQTALQKEVRAWGEMKNQAVEDSNSAKDILESMVSLRKNLVSLRMEMEIEETHEEEVFLKSMKMPGWNIPKEIDGLIGLINNLVEKISERKVRFSNIFKKERKKKPGRVEKGIDSPVTSKVRSKNKPKKDPFRSALERDNKPETPRWEDDI